VTTQKSVPKGKELADIIASHAINRKAEFVAVVQLTGAMGIADWFVICQGGNAPHNRAIADEIIEELKKAGVRPWHTEGLADSRWVLVDYSDVVVHVMQPDLRKYYALEELWPESVTIVHNGESIDE
jgi:ribosome-associated protein